MCDTNGHVLSCAGCQEEGQLLYLLNHLTGLSIISLFTFRVALMRALNSQFSITGVFLLNIYIHVIKLCSINQKEI